MKITILGCGPSIGVPSLAHGYGACNPLNPLNKRTRCSLLIENKGKHILVDTSPDVRYQLLKVNRPRIDSILYTHAHYDHMGGADDVVRQMIWKYNTLSVYISPNDAEFFKKLCFYLFEKESYKDSFYLNYFHNYEEFQIENCAVLPIPQQHHKTTSYGFRMGDFAYSTDVFEMEEKAFSLLKGVKVWILGVLSPEYEMDKHLYIEKALNWVERIRPQKVFFTHMGDTMDYDTLCQKLPPFVRPCFDGMELEI